MKTGILTIMVLASILLCSGCDLATGIGTGAALEQIATQAERDLAENIVLVQQRNEELREALAAMESEEDRAAITGMIEANDGLTVKMEDALLGLKIARQAAKTNWADPEAVGAFSAAIITAGLAVFYRKRGKTAAKKYDAHKIGVNRMVLANPKIAEDMYEAIGEERAKVGL